MMRTDSSQSATLSHPYMSVSTHTSSAIINAVAVKKISSACLLNEGHAALHHQKNREASFEEHVLVLTK